jgi:CheY-like chemotaxis protein
MIQMSSKLPLVALPKHVEVLLVEDNAVEVRLIRQVLAGEPFPVTIHVAVNGEEAMGMLTARRCDPDLIILDLNLPKLSGLSLLEAIRPRVPVVVFSSSVSPQDMKRSFELGVSDFVPKPDDLDSFKRVVSYIVRRWGSGTEYNGNSSGFVSLGN